MPLSVLPVEDSDALAADNRAVLDISSYAAASLGRSAVQAIESGRYGSSAGHAVDWFEAVDGAKRSKVSIPPDASLGAPRFAIPFSTAVRVANLTTLVAARHLVDGGERPLLLSFANGVQPGGGFLSGSRAQEEVLCRSSALFATLVGDAMYAAHKLRPLPDSTSWAILSPRVPVFRNDGGDALSTPWLADFLTCAAPYAPRVGHALSRDLLRERISRVLAIARTFEYETLVLGAWGCGAFGNDPYHTAIDFRNALESEFDGVFREVVFAVTDWSEERRFLGPFGDVFAADSGRA